MRFFAVKRGHGLYPADDESVAEFDKLPSGKPLQVEAKQPRNIKHHKLYWALCARIGRGIGKDAEWIDRAFKIESGHVDVFNYGGKAHLVPRSIAFDKLDQVAFSEFFESCVQTAYSVWHVDPASVADLLAKEESQKR